MSSPVDIAVVGSCNVDLISYVDRLPKAGETICASKFEIGCGGKGANQCVMAAKLGASTSMISSVGDDDFGQMYLRNFTELNIDTRYVKQVSGIPTGVAPITVYESTGENSIIIAKGANEHITASDLKHAKGIITGAKVVICQLEIDLDITLAALKMAHETGVCTIFNPAPAVKDLPYEFLRNTSILCCNETEAELMTGMSVSSDDQVEAAAYRLLEMGPSTVIITLGARGAAIINTSTGSEKHSAAQFVQVQDAYKCSQVVDTTGAGDSFVGSLAFFLSCAELKQLTLAQCVQRAVNIAAVSVTKKGTQKSYPTRQELRQELFS